MRGCGSAKRALAAGLTLLAALGGAADPGASPSPYRVVGDGIPVALTAQGGDAARGRAVFVDRDRGHCLLCHTVASIDEPFHGTLGPDLSGVGDRLSVAQLRLRLVDSTRLNPETVMPAYHRVDNLRQVGEVYVGKPVLEAQEIEDVIAYLATLRAERAGQ